jgi:hypothetical protein
MGPKRADPSRILRATGGGFVTKTICNVPWPLSGRNTAIAAAVMGLLAIAAFGVLREATPTGHAAASSLSHPAAVKPHPAFTRAEEAYIQALWPIHGDIERSAVRTSLGAIFYTTNDLPKADLKVRIEAALTTYRHAEARISALQPPLSLARAHDDYLVAVRLFEQSASEALKMFDDDNDGHLLVAHSFSQQGSNKIREIGGRFWQDEFPPN